MINLLERLVTRNVIWDLVPKKEKWRINPIQPLSHLFIVICVAGHCAANLRSLHLTQRKKVRSAFLSGGVWPANPPTLFILDRTRYSTDPRPVQVVLASRSVPDLMTQTFTMSLLSRTVSIRIDSPF